MSTIKKTKGVIAILTGGGDVPGLNPAIRAVTIRALREGYQVIGLRRGWAGIMELIRDPEAARGLGAEAAITTATGAVIVQYPRSMAASGGEGHVLLYRPSERSADRTLPVAADTAAQQVIPFTSLSPGLWRIQVLWIMRGEEYYMEQPFMVP